MNNSNFFDLYFKYIGETECPLFYHRWCALSGIGAMLGRNYFIQHGHFTINPNMYVMLIGSPGTRKSTAIKIMKSLVVASGYTYTSADKTTKEKFLLDLHEQNESESENNILDANIWGSGKDNAINLPPAEMYIAADEFNDFIGNGNIEFISLLGSLWDYNGVYENKIKNGKSVYVNNPTISILSGNTPTGFALAFPVEILGQGFFSRLLLVYGEGTGKRITFPEPPSAELKVELITKLVEIKTKCSGPAKMSSLAKSLLDKIYKTYESLDDVRFESYSNRRFTHLLKLCILHSAARASTEITEDDVIYANTVLAHTEHLMPKALGQFGKSRHSDVIHKIITILEKASAPVSPKDIITAIHSDVDTIATAVDIIKGLHTADKIMLVNGGYLCKRRIRTELDSDIFNIALLHKDELQY
jgi:energy-coupling factor transporter ATP-binding protein EcfA2